MTAAHMPGLRLLLTSARQGISRRRLAVRPVPSPARDANGLAL
jgi:hypothetical protein